MNIDEAIKHCKEVADNQNKCVECRQEHDQLAEWLKELKIVREIAAEQQALNRELVENLEKAIWHLENHDWGKEDYEELTGVLQKAKGAE